MQFSIAVNLVRSSPDERMDRVAAEALELVQTAEAGGFNIAWAAEHHGLELTVSPNPLTLLMHWAAHTRTIRLGTAVVVAPYWHPLRLAGEAAMVDVLTGGRLELGIARGAFQYEFDRMGNGIDQREGTAYLHELVPAVRALWAGDYAHEGRFWRFPKSTSVPKPVQDPHPPLWVAARGPETFDWGIENGLDIMATPLGRPFSEVETLAARFEDGLARIAPARRPRLLVLRRTAVFESEADWPAIADAGYHYGRRFAGLFDTRGTVDNGFPAEPVDADDEARAQAITESRENMVYGTPEEVVAKLEAYAAAGVDHYCYGADFGLPHRLAKHSLDLFIREVMPHFRSEPARAARA